MGERFPPFFVKKISDGKRKKKLTVFPLKIFFSLSQADNDIQPPAPRSSDPLSLSNPSAEGLFGLLDVEDAGAPALEVFVSEEGEEGGQGFPSTSSSPSPSPSGSTSSISKKKKLGPLVSQATVLRARGLGLRSSTATEKK